jgi:hypothetical protein
MPKMKAYFKKLCSFTIVMTSVRLSVCHLILGPDFEQSFVGVPTPIVWLGLRIRGLGVQNQDKNTPFHTSIELL